MYTLHCEDILHKFGKCKYLTKFDIRDTYMDIKVSRRSNSLTINTTEGLYPIRSLMYETSAIL